MKRMLAILAVFAIIFSFVACKSKGTVEGEELTIVKIGDVSIELMDTIEDIEASGLRLKNSKTIRAKSKLGIKEIEAELSEENLDLLYEKQKDKSYTLSEISIHTPNAVFAGELKCGDAIEKAIEVLGEKYVKDTVIFAQEASSSAKTGYRWNFEIVDIVIYEKNGIIEDCRLTLLV